MELSYIHDILPLSGDENIILNMATIYSALPIPQIVNDKPVISIQLTGIAGNDLCNWRLLSSDAYLEHIKMYGAPVSVFQFYMPNINIVTKDSAFKQREDNFLLVRLT